MQNVIRNASDPNDIRMIVTRTENICFGRPRVDGTRLEVYNVVSSLESSATIEEFQSDWNIPTKDLLEIVDYCKRLHCQKMSRTFEKYCSNCTLSNLHEGSAVDINSLDEISPGIFQDKTNPNFIALGEREELADELSGRPGWIIADEVWTKLFLT